MAGRSIGFGTRVGLALGAGLFGAAVMFASQKLEMRVTGRAPSLVPARAVETLTTAEPADDRVEERRSNLGHFGFGTAMGIGLLLLDRVPEPARTPLFAAGAWAAGNAAMVALGVADPPTGWTREELATDLGHHLVYGLAAGVAYAAAGRLLEGPPDTLTGRPHRR